MDATDTVELRFDVSDDALRQKWAKSKEELVAAGWSVAENATGASVGHATAGFANVSVRLCTDPTRSDSEGAIVPDGFRLLEALGAAGIEKLLAGSVPDGIAVEKVIVGLNWTLVRAGAYCGIARSPARGVEGARTIRPENGFAGASLHDLAQYLLSTDPLSRSLGLAAVNAYWNRADADYPELKPEGGFSALEPPGEGVVVIGGFRGALRRLPEAVVVEREPKAGDIPADRAADAIAGAGILAITAQTLMNGTLALLLAGAGRETKRILIGPSAPLCPLLLDQGIDEVSAVVVHDADAAEMFICETGSMIMLDHIATSRYLG